MPNARSAHTNQTAPTRSMLRLVSTETSHETAGGPATGPFSRHAGDAFDIRPIRPTDADLIVAALGYTSGETYYRRFHAAKRYFSPKELTYLTHVDGETHVALVAVQGGEDPRLAAVARFSTDPQDPREAELAICVHDPFRRQGLGARLLSRLRDEAGSRGVTRLRAIVQSDNVPMRELLYQVFPGTSVDRIDGNEVEYLSPMNPGVPIGATAGSQLMAAIRAA